MTIPYERTRSLVQAKELLQRLADGEVPSTLRAHAQGLLRNFPTLAEIDKLHLAAPDLIGPAPPFSRLSGSGDVLGVIEAARTSGIGGETDKIADE
jgi:hypothetical protein